MKKLTGGVNLCHQKIHQRTGSVASDECSELINHYPDTSVNCNENMIHPFQDSNV